MDAAILVTIPRVCRARVYAEGGIGYDSWVDGMGWVADDDPDADFETIVEATRRLALSPRQCLPAA